MGNQVKLFLVLVSGAVWVTGIASPNWYRRHNLFPEFHTGVPLFKKDELAWKVQWSSLQHFVSISTVVETKEIKSAVIGEDVS